MSGARTLFIATFAFFAASCGDHNGQIREQIQDVEPGVLIADNVVIDDNGRGRAAGPIGFALGEPDPASGEMQFTGRVGAQILIGPKIVYVFRTIPSDAAERFNKDGVKVREHAAYLLPEGAQPTLDAIRDAELIGRVDPALSEEEVLALFGLGGEEEAAAAPNSVTPAVDEAAFDEQSRDKIADLRERIKVAAENAEVSFSDISEYTRWRTEEMELKRQLAEAIASAREKTAAGPVED